MNVVVTGATRGIGLAIAKTFAAQGFNLALCARTPTQLAAIQRQFQQQYPSIKVLIKSTDISQKNEVMAFADFIKKHWTQVNVLVNNAGTYLPGQFIEETDDLLETLINTNLYSAYHLTRALLPTMLPYKRGHIFNICSIASLFAYPNGGAYSISKFAMLGMSKVQRAELKTHGIRVTAVLPGATWSGGWENSGIDSERLIDAEDIARTILSAYQLSHRTVVEEILLRPQLGDL